MSGKRESNPRPSAWEADALPTELFPRILITNQKLLRDENTQEKDIEKL